MTALYVGGTPAGLFTDESISWGVGPTSRLPLKFGVMFFDWDLDGRLDLVSINGHLEEEITKVQASQKYRQPAQLFWNAGAAGFVPVGPEQAGSALFTPIVGRGCAQADLDGDGDEDLLFTQTGGAPLLLRNDRPIDRRWVRLKLVGTRANRDALGATVQLKAGGKTQWRTVTGGSRAYVKKLTASFADRIRLNSAVRSVARTPIGVVVTAADGSSETYDHVIMAAHSDQTLKVLSDASGQERKLLGDIRYETNHAILHTDQTMMPKRRRAWASWNYISEMGDSENRLVCLTYWMNRLQNLDQNHHAFVTLNPHRDPRPESIVACFDYEHPIFDQAALKSQKQLWAIQGTNRTWFCGAYFGHGFHEDGLQSGLAVAEALGGGRRPWTVAEESGRIFLSANAA